MSQCKLCGATIYFGPHPISGKNTPLNPDGTVHFSTCGVPAPKKEYRSLDEIPHEEKCSGGWTMLRWIETKAGYRLKLTCSKNHSTMIPTTDQNASLVNEPTNFDFYQYSRLLTKEEKIQYVRDLRAEEPFHKLLRSKADVEIEHDGFCGAKLWSEKGGGNSNAAIIEFGGDNQWPDCDLVRIGEDKFRLYIVGTCELASFLGCMRDLANKQDQSQLDAGKNLTT